MWLLLAESISVGLALAEVSSPAESVMYFFHLVSIDAALVTSVTEKLFAANAE
jgi:hypothetical protein